MNRVKFERLRDLPEDTSFLTDADWRELNKWRKAHATGGDKALLKAARDLMKKDIVQLGRIWAAYFPDTFREALKDYMAKRALTIEDLKEMIAKAESPSTKKH